MFTGVIFFYFVNSSRSEYTDQLVSDIASYYGYNDFLAEKMFLLFPPAEVRALMRLTGHPNIL